MKNNNGSTLIMILAIIALIAIPFFYGSRPPATQTNDASAPTNISAEIPAEPGSTDAPPQEAETEAVAPVVDKLIDPNISKYSKNIEITSVSGGSSDVRDESITISNVGEKDSISITDFFIETYEKESFKIPKGHDLPGLPGSVPGNIVLRPGDQAVIYVNTQERKTNFRENLCTGYFDQFSDFNGALYHSCPTIDVSKRLDFSDSCINILESIPSCTIFGSGVIVENICNQYANTHYNYVGCVQDFKTRSDFYSNRWVVWMQRGIEFFRNDREQIFLKDTEGKVVSEYNY